MRIEMKTAVALLSTNLRKALPALLAVLALTSCGAGDDSSSCLFSAPAPRIDSYPPTVATAGHLYGYGVDATYSCWFFPLVPTTCGGITGLLLPAGASAGGSGVSWTPAANQVNANVNFAISTLPDICGNRVTQSWSVHVYAPPVIESFTAERASILPGESTVLTGVFQGTGRIEGLGPLMSGVPVATPVLNTPTTFTLIVTNSAGAQVSQTLTVEMPPTVIFTSPVNGATEVPVNGALIVRFSKQMDSATITSSTFLLKGGSNNLVSGTVTAAGYVATFVPTKFLGYLTPYSAIITNGVKDTRGNSMAADYVWSFVSDANPDTTPPRVISTFPANEAGGVATGNIELLVTLSESIDPNSVNSTTFILMDSSQNPVNGNILVTNGGNTAAFQTPILANSMSYTAIVTTGIKDLADNPMAAAYSWTFTTEEPGLGTWRATSTTGAPSARAGHTAVWTGSEMIVWGGLDNGESSTGARYNLVTDVWAPTSNIGAPPARSNHTAVWTGSEMIVWGGFNASGFINSGGRYNPVTDVWAPISNIGTPSPRVHHTAVWTGSEMIVWGGVESGRYLTNSGGRYNPVTDAWAPSPNLTSARAHHTAVWTGSEMIIWGGEYADNYGSHPTNSGVRYNPATNVWAPTSNIGVPSTRSGHTAIWTGSEMIVWGGGDNSGQINTGGRYTPATDDWAPTSNIGVPSTRSGYTAVWTSREMIVWGGSNSPSLTNSGARYKPVTDLWAPTANTGAPSARSGHTAVWTGSEMIVWGGSGSGNPSNTGGRYRP